MHRLRWIAFLALFVGFGAVISPRTLAQTGGQLCVMNFEDRDANGIFDPQTDPAITRGVSVELLDVNNIVVASGLLDRSPNANNGVICFQNLPDGTYSLMLSSADYAATTPRLVQRTINAASVIVPIEFGWQRTGERAAPLTPPNAQPISLQDMTSEQLQAFILRGALALAGAVVVMLVMGGVGTGFYMMRMRNNQPRPVKYNPAAVQRLDETQIEGVGRFMPPQEPPPAPDDTSPIKPL